jgi:hypothetical protein
VIRQDRRELSFLGALLLGWALVAAPLVHLLVSHAEPPASLGQVRSLPLSDQGHSHSHGPGPSAPGEHGQGSLEHGKALFSASPAAPSLVLVLVSLAFVLPQPPASVARAVWPRVEQSQGP